MRITFDIFIQCETNIFYIICLYNNYGTNAKVVFGGYNKDRYDQIREKIVDYY